MKSTTKNKPQKETVKVDERTTVCSGNEYPYDHPTVYLEIPEKKTSVECPYCSRVFVLK